MPTVSSPDRRTLGSGSGLEGELQAKEGLHGQRAQGWGGMLGGPGLGLIRGSEQGHNIGTRACGNVNGQTEMDGCGRE